MFAKTNLVIFAIVSVTLIINIVNFFIQNEIEVSYIPCKNRLVRNDLLGQFSYVISVHSSYDE